VIPLPWLRRESWRIVVAAIGALTDKLKREPKFSRGHAELATVK